MAWRPDRSRREGRKSSANRRQGFRGGDDLVTTLVDAAAAAMAVALRWVLIDAVVRLR